MLEKRDCNGIVQDITHIHTHVCVCKYISLKKPMTFSSGGFGVTYVEMKL